MPIPPQRAPGDSGHVGDHNDMANMLTEHEGEITDLNTGLTSHTGGIDPHGDRAYADSLIGGQVPGTRQVLAGTGLTGGGDLAEDVTLAVSYGMSEGTAAQGNDGRITGAQQRSTLTSKGDLYVATGAGVVIRLPVGTDAQVLIADAAEAAGVRWADPAQGVRTADSGFVETGNIAVSTSFTQIGPDLTIDAAAGDVLEIATDFMCVNTGNDVQFDAATRVADTDTNWWSTGGSASRWPGGLGAWYVSSGSFSGPRSAPRYTVQAGDVVSGQVTVRLYGRCSGGSRTVNASATYPLRWWINNLGPVV